MSQLNKIIAISGLKGSGKNEVSSMLEFLSNTPKIFHSYFWYKNKRFVPKTKKYKIVAFADPIKEMLSSLLNMKRSEFESRQIKESCIVFLPNLQRVYTNGCMPNNTLYNTLSDSKFAKLAKDWNCELSNHYWLTIRQIMQLFGTEIMRGIINDKIWINSVLGRSCKNNLIISDLRFITEYNSIKERGGFTIYVDRGLEPGSHKSESEMQILLKENKFDLIINNKNITLKELFYKIKNLINNKSIW